MVGILLGNLPTLSQDSLAAAFNALLGDINALLAKIEATRCLRRATIAAGIDKMVSFEARELDDPSDDACEQAAWGLSEKSAHSRVRPSWCFSLSGSAHFCGVGTQLGTKQKTCNFCVAKSIS